MEGWRLGSALILGDGGTKLMRKGLGMKLGKLASSGRGGLGIRRGQREDAVDGRLWEEGTLLLYSVAKAGGRIRGRGRRAVCLVVADRSSGCVAPPPQVGVPQLAHIVERRY